MIRHTIIASSALAMLAAADKGSGANAPKVPDTAPPAPPAPAAGANTTAAAKPEVKAIRKGVERPANAKKAGAKSKYDFDSLEVGDSFGVVGKTAQSFNSIIYTAEQRFAVDVLGENGSPKTRIKKLKGGATEVVNQKAKTREFSAYDVDPATDPDKATVRVFRDK